MVTKQEARTVILKASGESEEQKSHEQEEDLEVFEVHSRFHLFR